MPSRLSARLMLVSACVLVLFAGLALAQDEYRAVLGDEAGIFPDAQFRKIFHFPKATVVTFETGAAPAEITAFYKKDMTGRGWSVEVDDAGKAASYLLLTKNGRRCIVEAQRGLPGRTGFSVSL